jgi:dynein heavy chain
VVLCCFAELPESLKALFRPVSMVVPDLGLICEIMLMAEGFQMSKILSRKFVILYKLCEDLLSKSKHYDWKLRAIKTTLYVAGGMKRAAPELTEDKVRDSQGVTCDLCQPFITVSAVVSRWRHPLLDEA